MKKPNIVYIHSHDMGKFCAPMGYDIPAPNMMRLAQQGVLFRQCHAASPSCAPSRAALLTGQHPHRCGMMGLPSPKLGYKLNDYQQHLGAFLKRHGYETALSGVQHVARAPWAPPEEVLPYDHFLNETPTGRQMFDPARTAAAAVDYLTQEHEQPFFLSIGFLDPHRDNQGDNRVFIESQPAQEPADIDERARYCQPFPHFPDNAVTRREMANFKMGVAMLDADLGRVMNALDRPEYRENTLVIFTSDHGPGVSEMKCTLTDRGTGTVLILRGPSNPEYGPASGFNGGKVVDGLTQHLDIYPTICEALGTEILENLDGKSMFPLLDIESAEIHEEIFTEQTYHYNPAPRPFRALRTSRYKYIRSFKADQDRGIDFGPSQAFWNEFGYREQQFDDHMLFDLVFDPNEAHNVAHDPNYAEIREDLQARLQDWMERTGDPLASGKIPLPPAANS